MKHNYHLLVLAGLLMLSVTAFAQEFQVNGRVTDSFTGDPLAGVNVIVKGTTTGTITDIEGYYNVQVPDGRTAILFSFIGYVTIEQAVNSSTSNIDIKLEEDITNLEEIVITGLASSVKRSNLANAVSSISGDELTGNTTHATLDNALFGKMTGVNMVSNSGAPGGGVNVQLRGISTMGAGSSQPLYIIDGVYIDNSVIRNGRTQVSGASGGQSTATQDDASNRIADINPEDIESIEVLKGPSAAAIYGTRANAGVIIITTKRGTAGRTVVKWRQDIGFNEAMNFQKFEGWDNAKIEVVDGTGAASDSEKSKLAQNGQVDWEEELYGERGLLVNSQLSIAGGTDRTKFFVSGGLQSEDGIIQRTGFDRYSIRANIDHKLSSKLDFTLSTMYARTKTERGFTGNQNNTGGSLGYNIAYTRSYAGLQPDASGNYPDNPYFNDNPYAIRDLAENEENVDRFITSVGFNWNILQTPNSQLKFTFNGGIDFLSSRSFVYFPEILQHQKALANPGDVMHGKQENLNSNAQAFLIWNVQGGAVNFNTQIGTTWLTQDRDLLLIRGQGLAAGQTNLRWANVVSVQADIEGHVIDQGLVAQEEINWEDKIIGTLGIRFDRSTLNLQQTKFYAFPKASVAANLTNFNFWTSSAINQLKLRVAYGETGGLPLLGNTYESLTPQLIGGELGAQVAAGTQTARAVDDNLQPETATEYEIGLDMAFLDNRLGFEFTYYNKSVNDLILDQQPVESSGYTAIAINAADLVNKGIEFALNYQVIRNTNFTWLTRLMYWSNDQEITRLDIPPYTIGGFGPSLGTYMIAEGFSPTTIVGNPAIPADDNSPLGFTVIGDRMPDWQASWYNEISFLKNFTFNFLLHTARGQKNINLSALLWDDGGSTPNWSEVVAGDHATNFGTERLLQWAVSGNTSVYVQDASYVKLREIGLFYTFPSDMITGAFGGTVSRIKLGITGNNVALWSDYGSYDPEVSNFGVQAITSSIEVTPFPNSRRLLFHLSVDF